MCRLFGLTSAPERTRATFWLLDAPDSLSAQSHRDPDGTGLGHFDPDGTPRVGKAPLAAYADRAFAVQARRAESTTFVAHIRYATTGRLDARNTHPFAQDGRLFAHNGVVEGLDALEARLGPDRSLVGGDTDSERVFALITREIRAHGGDTGAGIAAAVNWIADHLPLYALNFVLATPTDLWALRYPDTHDLYVLRRPAGGHHGCRHLDHSGSHGRMRVHSADLSAVPSTVVASERMDDNPHWRLLDPGELLHVGPDHAATSHAVLPRPPAHPLTLADLHPHAAAAQKSA
ncbi:class II glutamine amidotransferase [Streptomyces huiliensis]|uniref:class II glutamine amidotransferase n=1 Tax=Streptomyces huiliensis TaxID=2876027 RepID=UPI001CBEFA14|nr:class II glutamine amidotransferase [Streptomyces huiliensis]MBZ4323068.1 class II glutamine amidotransferase [Streptomyces huiliensis]